MKKKNALYGLLSLILVFLVIEGSTGITAVLHHCTSHGESMMISSLLPSEETDDECCRESIAITGGSNDCCGHDLAGNNNGSTYKDHCCNYEFSSLKITNYLPTLKFELITPLLLNSFFSATLSIAEPLIPAYDEYTLSKPGGRGIIKSTCALLS